MSLYTVNAGSGPLTDIHIGKVPDVILPGITQEEFEDAFKVLQESYVYADSSAPVFGFTYPFCGPGGAYGACWWQLDTSLALCGAKWVDQKFAENVLRNFIGIIHEDGRIPLHGPDTLLDENNKCSSLPKLFQVAYEVLSRSEDKQLLNDAYEMLKKYLNWWLKDRRVEDSGLIKAIVEEWLPGSNTYMLSVETNVEVLVGLDVVSRLAGILGKSEDEAKYKSEFEELKAAVNKYMWNEKQGRYTSLKPDGKATFSTGYSVACFNPLKLCIADENHIEAMLSDLTDNDLFQWDTYALTSAAKTDRLYNETPGVYAACQWNGSIWSLRNYDVVQGLEDIGKYDLASYLALKTVNEFSGNYAEFLDPPDGSGQGVLRYSWTASQYIQLIIEHIFGVNYDSFTKTVRIEPHIDKSLKGQKIEMKSLLLPNGGELDLSIDNREDATIIDYSITGLKDFDIVIALPEYETEYVAVNKSAVSTASGKYGKLAIVQNGRVYSDTVIFTSAENEDKYAPHSEPTKKNETIQVLSGYSDKQLIIMGVCLSFIVISCLTVVILKSKERT